MLRRYLESASNPEERRFRADFESSIRGGYWLTDREAKGWLGPATLHESGDPLPRNGWLFAEKLKNVTPIIGEEDAKTPVHTSY